MAKRGVHWFLALAFTPVAVALSGTYTDPAEALRAAPGKNDVAYFGNAGCAATGCHNSNGPRGTSGSEYSTWANEDPHSRAFSALNSAAGQRMERLYRRDQTADAGKDQLCLKCHAPLGMEKDNLRSDAVGCESCHGSSAQWRTTHYLNEWKALNVKGIEHRGMKPTKDLTTRVELCADCHVGKQGMEVDHDLIAAGHPRLFFEYSAYHDLLPRHWQEPKADTSFHARAWAIGRVTAAKVAVELLHDRAAQPDRWPELAEYNCYSCHQQLSDKTTKPVGRDPGSMAAGSWHFALLDSIAGLGAEFAPAQPVDSAPLLKTLHAPQAKPEDIAAAAKPLVAALAAWQTQLSRVRDIDLATMKKQLAAQSPRDWEQATQHYLAINALHRSQPPSDQRQRAMKRLRDILKFPPAELGKKIDSPRNFNLGNYTTEANKLLSHSATSHSVPKGRHNIAQGVSPGSTRILAHSPEGAAHSTVPHLDDPIAGAPLVSEPGPNANNADLCKTCHAGELPQFRSSYDLIKNNPSTTWADEDPHAKAWDNLNPATNDVARRMKMALGYDLSRKPECLMCHAVDVTPDRKQIRDKQFTWEHNVGCEACHGFAKYWLGPHMLKDEWRKKSPTDKTALGLVDLRDPATRAAKCASCHVGNVAEGKFVTHEMYAAGHPPLLPFEPATFGRDQPAHWNLPDKVEYFKKLNDGDAKRLYHFDKSEDYVARSLAVGAVVNLRETARTVQQAANDAPAGAMLDFAHFDCFACHHELVTPSQRQQRGYTGTPGRPTVRTLPTELVEAVVGRLPPVHRQQLSADVQQLRSAYDVRPFGKPEDIAAAAGQLAERCDLWLNELKNVKYDEAGKRQLLTAITNGKNMETWDYDTAQQFTWAARLLKSYDHVGEEWHPLQKQVLLGAGLGSTRKVEASLAERLRMRYAFDAERFVNGWRQLPK